jgi:hypothetical protein
MNNLPKGRSKLISILTDKIRQQPENWENELVENEPVLCTVLAYCPSSTIRLHVTINCISTLSSLNRI